VRLPSDFEVNGGRTMYNVVQAVVAAIILAVSVSYLSYAENPIFWLGGLVLFLVGFALLWNAIFSEARENASRVALLRRHL
jgi:uncharacterized membrane protein